MRAGWMVAALGLAAAGAPGCRSTPPLSQAQITALETRQVDAPVAEAYTAAASALFDAGYTILMSDRDAGLLTGTRSREHLTYAGFGRRRLARTDYTISIQVRPLTPERTAVRVKTAINGEPRINKDAIDQFWLLMQRQVLMHEPAAGEPAGG